MGPLVVFSPEENSFFADKTRLLSPSSSGRPATPTPLVSKARSTISICALLLLTTILLFALSTIEPTTPRRFLSRKSLAVDHILDNSTSTTNFNSSNWFPNLWGSRSHHNASKSERSPSHALQRMGTLYRRGTGAMRDLVVGHVEDDTTDDEFKLFLRVMHRSGLTSRADIVFIFASTFLSSRLAPIIHEENESFFSLIHHYRTMNSTLRNDQKRSPNFHVTKFLMVATKRREMGEPLWGKTKKNGTNLINPEAGRNESESDHNAVLLSYGSVLSFDPTELDPEISLAGFLDQVPLSLRRWACYPMLLDRVKRAFKNVMLVDVKNLVVVKDPLGRVKNQNPDSVFLYSKQSERNSDKTRSHHRVNTAIIMGGTRGIRRLSKAMVLEIVRVAMLHHKEKNTVSESAILSELVGKAFMSKSMKLITSSESIPDTSSLNGRDSAAAASLSDYAVIQRSTGDGDHSSFIKKHLCSSVVDSSVYRDC